MTAPRVQERRRISRTEYDHLRSLGFDDDDLAADGLELDPADGPKGPKFGGYSVLAGLGSGLLHGGSFGFADELAGLDAATSSLSSLMHPVQSYRAGRDRVRAAMERHKQETPGAFLGGEVTGAVLSPVGKLLVPTKGAALARGAKAGAAGGALYGAGVADNLSDLPSSTAIGGTIGGVGGLLGTAAVQGLRGLGSRVVSTEPGLRAVNTIRARVGQAPIDPIDRAERKAAQAVVRALGRDQVPFETIGAELPEGDPRLLYNMGGKATSSLTRVAQAIPSEATDQVPRVIGAQLEGGPERLLGTMESVIGKKIPNPIVRQQELTEEAARVAAPWYNRLRTRTIPASPELGEVLERPSVARALQRARSNLADQGIRTPAPEAIGAVSPAPSSNPDLSERGLWLTARTARGSLRKPETVETQGLVDDLIRREELSRRYYADTRKYGPTSAVTQRNDDAIARIRDVLRLRDEIPEGDLVEMMDSRIRELFPEGTPGVNPRTRARDALITALEREGHAKPRPYVPNEPTVIRGSAAPKPPVRFEELDHAKKVLDADIESINEKIAAGMASGADKSRLLGLEKARQALVDQVDYGTAGDYARARAVAAKGISKREAFREGTKYSTARRDALEQEIPGMSAENQAAYREGAATSIENVVKSTPDRGNLAKRLFATDAEREKLRVAFGGDKQGLAALETAFKAEDRLRREATDALLSGQSMTTPLREALDEFQGSAIEQIARSSGVWNATKRLALNAYFRMTRDLNSRAATELGKLLTSKPGPALAGKLTQAQRDAVMRAVRRGQTGRRAGSILGLLTTGDSR